MNTLLIAATVAVVSTIPSPSAVGGTVLFRSNEHIITFNQPVVTHEIEMVEDSGCKVSQGSTADGEKVIVQMKACARNGYQPGHMRVRWKVNGASGDYHLHVRKHH